VTPAWLPSPDHEYAPTSPGYSPTSEYHPPPPPRHYYPPPSPGYCLPYQLDQLYPPVPPPISQLLQHAGCWPSVTHFTLLNYSYLTRIFDLNAIAFALPNLQGLRPATLVDFYGKPGAAALSGVAASLTSLAFTYGDVPFSDSNIEYMPDPNFNHQPEPFNVQPAPQAQPEPQVPHAPPLDAEEIPAAPQFLPAVLTSLTRLRRIELGEHEHCIGAFQVSIKEMTALRELVMTSYDFCTSALWLPGLTKLVLHDR
jgi:hypothetical protein